MRRAILQVFCTLLLVYLTLTTAQTVNYRNSDFAFELYQNLASINPGENIFFSPVSVSTCVASLCVGARHTTKQQISKVFHFKGLGIEEMNEQFSELITNLNEPTNKYTLKIVNTIFARKNCTIEKDFLKTIVIYYNSGLYHLDFIHQPEESRRRINEWVKKKTMNKIDDFLPPGSITPITTLIMANAIYFKGFWEVPFNPRYTKALPFHISPNHKFNMDMMHATQFFRYQYSAELKCKLLEIPYFGEKASMIVFLPDNNNELERLERKLNSTNLRQAIQTMSVQKVEVQFPKFKFSQSINLKGILASMGVHDLFDSDAADLSGITGSRNLYVTEILHKSFIDINENGTEAAAVTGIFTFLSAIPPSMPKFIANHPFIFLVFDKTTESILFLGRLSKPTAFNTRIGTFGGLVPESNGTGSLCNPMYKTLLLKALVAVFLFSR